MGNEKGVAAQYVCNSTSLSGGDEESRTPVRKCRPMNLSERRPC